MSDKSLQSPPSLPGAAEPATLYKYYSINQWTQQIFERNEVYFSPPDCFNDPFDSRLCTTYEGTEDQRVSRLMDFWRRAGVAEGPEQRLRDTATELVKGGKDVSLLLPAQMGSANRVRKRMGVFSMSRQKDNVLMWSHYASNHTGFCLQFHTSHPFFEQVRPVHYKLARPRLNLIKPPDREWTAQALLTKAEGWQYEEEWRLIDYSDGPGVKSFPAEALTGVILGCRISPQNRVWITELCRKRSPQPSIYWAEESAEEFALVIRPIDFPNMS